MYLKNVQTNKRADAVRSTVVVGLEY